MKQTLKFKLSGRVQGVFFRVSTKQQADSLGLGGWVRNCEDGSVEGMASGAAEQLNTFRSWLERGPKMAQVQSLKTELCDYQIFAGFNIR